MGILQHSCISLCMSRFFAMTFLCLSLLAPQYLLSKPKDPSSIRKEKNNLFKEKNNIPKEKKKTEKLNIPEILKSTADLKDTLFNQEFVIPQFNQSIMRHSEKQNKYVELYLVPTRSSSVLEYRGNKKKFEALYNKNISLLTQDKNAPTRIPKVVHQIWLGGEVPEEYIIWMSTWMNMEGWEYKLWRDSDVEKFSLHNRELYNNAKDYGEKADILRYEILYREGGLYVDVDFENVNPGLFDRFNQSFDFYAGIEPMEHRQPVNSPIVGNAIIASIPGHPILERVIVDMNSHYNQNETKWAVVATGPVHFTKKINEYIRIPDEKYINIILPPTFFFPITHSEARTNVRNNFLKFMKPETAAIHYWSGSWIEEEEVQKPQSKPKKSSSRYRNWFK